MGFEPTFEKLNSAGLKRLCVHQAVVEARLLASGGVLISKVLSIAADCASAIGDVFTAEARYSGKVNFKVMFVCQEGNLHSMDYTAEFTDKLLCTNIHGGLRPSVHSVILDTDIVSADEREIKLACVVETSLDATDTTEYSVLVNAPDDIYLEKKQLEFSRLVAESYPTFALTETIALKAGTVLLSEARIVTTKRTAGFDSAILEGNIFCDLTLADENGMLHNLTHITAFKEEFSLEGTRDDNFMLATAALTNHTVAVEHDGEKFSATIEFAARAELRAFSTDTLEIVEDCFSVGHDLELATSELQLAQHKFCTNFTDRVEGSVTLDNAMPLADNILAITGSKLHIASITANEGRLTYDGIVSCNVIFWASENNTRHSVAVELPFSIGANNNMAEATDEFLAKGIVTNVAARIVRGTEIQIKADIDAEITALASVTKTAITALELGQERPVSDSAFSVHVGRAGESLWDVAKALGITPESVEQQNPNTQLPLVGGERLMCYRQKR